MGISQLGLNIKSARERKGWSLNKLKQESGVGYATLHDIESGKSQNLNSANLEKIAKALNIATNELLGIDVVEYTVTDLGETLNIILDSDELELDGVLLSKSEKEELKELFIFGINSIRRTRRRSNAENSNI